MRSQIHKGLIILCAAGMAPTACRKEQPKKKTRSEAVAEASRQRRMVINFANGIRSVLEWRQTQPVAHSGPSSVIAMVAGSSGSTSSPSKRNFSAPDGHFSIIAMTCARTVDSPVSGT